MELVPHQRHAQKRRDEPRLRIWPSTRAPLKPFRDKISFMGNIVSIRMVRRLIPHTCSDMWLTGALLGQPEAGCL